MARSSARRALFSLVESSWLWIEASPQSQRERSHDCGAARTRPRHSLVDCAHRVLRSRTARAHWLHSARSSARSVAARYSHSASTARRAQGRRAAAQQLSSPPQSANAAEQQQVAGCSRSGAAAARSSAARGLQAELLPTAHPARALNRRREHGRDRVGQRAQPGGPSPPVTTARPRRRAQPDLRIRSRGGAPLGQHLRTREHRLADERSPRWPQQRRAYPGGLGLAASASTSGERAHGRSWPGACHTDPLFVGDSSCARGLRASQRRVAWRTPTRSHLSCSGSSASTTEA